MTISEFKFEDKSLDWRLEQFPLNKLTLLVGASGVGKTQILRALMALKQIAGGSSINGISWEIKFETLANHKYIWKGEFENKGIEIFIDADEDDDDDDKKNRPRIIHEELLLNGEEVIFRDEEKILFMGNPTIKLSQQQSIIHLLKEEDKINPAYSGLRKLDFVDHSNSASIGQGFRFSFLNAKSLSKKYDTIVKIQESELETPLKLFFVQKADKKVFATIKQRFADIFPQIEDIKIASLETKEKEMPNFLKDYPFIQIKEKGVVHWISQNRISSGMYRTLIQLSELYLCSEGTVFLIDEFENSLGINCINEITNDILASKRKLQFVLTSHHPYIIDTIGFNNWKLVTRNAGIIKTHDIDKFNIGNSKHSAFMQLIQLEEYQTGQEQ
ncbi:AAA family ATPase [Emticicia sp. CRIBPO]|uniref:AAA family ATPase n=1 Tax=Emticicia sp. CRIBPO TaxID=2683258 RepID=UPI0014120B86|nr:AAA family ATPase [Emticicia sp. CRIBPO]NBA87706.1 AAA family ATPase [Emticicia sp. CRIBPO]